jgi:hypothetical protein
VEPTVQKPPTRGRKHLLKRAAAKKEKKQKKEVDKLEEITKK